jgi:hypothetical protein
VYKSDLFLDKNRLFGYKNVSLGDKNRRGLYPFAAFLYKNDLFVYKNKAFGYKNKIKADKNKHTVEEL